MSKELVSTQAANELCSQPVFFKEFQAAAENPVSCLLLEELRVKSPSG